LFLTFLRGRIASDAAHLSALGTAGCGLFFYSIIEAQISLGVRPRWIYFGRMLSTVLLFDAFFLFAANEDKGRGLALGFPTEPLVFAGLVIMHRSLTYFKGDLPKATSLTTATLFIALLFVFFNLGSPRLGFEIVASALFACALLAYRTYSIWIAKQPASV
jgi:hypothetical protein